MSWCIGVHGGAGDWRAERLAEALPGIQRAIEAGAEVLRAGGSAFDAVLASCVVLEDDPSFNAANGATLNIDGVAELDAAVMCGATQRIGAVANLVQTRNPVLVARDVMLHTDHVLLAGEGATRFARALGHAEHNIVHVDRLAAHVRRLRDLQTSDDAWVPTLRQLLREHPELQRQTVGAVALDSSGRCAVATSTGGVALKLAGRIGDSPIPGAGHYATRLGAAATTGRGELALRALPALRACDRLAMGSSAQISAHDTVQQMIDEVGDDIGLIVVDALGNFAAAHGTPAMPHGWISDRDSFPHLHDSAMH
jgi:beta-aspartyl-peptidase (threonine type)